MNPCLRSRRRRMPGWKTGVALAFLLASSSTPSNHRPQVQVDAFVLPQHRTTKIALKERKPGQLEFEKRSEKDLKSESSNTINSKSSQNITQTRNGAKAPAGTPLSMICKDTAEDPFELHVGRALDTLRKDYPLILKKQPDFSIYDNDVEVIDPTGVKLHGVKNYRNSFRLMHAIVQVFYCPERSGLTFRMCFDKARQNIRVSWNAEVIPKALFGGVRTTLHVDGISVYELSRETGMITQHRIERLVMNDTPIRPKQGIFDMLRSEHDESVPVYNLLKDDAGSNSLPNVGGLSNAVEFRSAERSALFSSCHDEVLSSTALSVVSAGDDNENNNDKYPGLDWEAFERKNASRKKFGVAPLTPEEYLENEALVQQMDSQQRRRASSASAAAEMTKGQNQMGPRPTFLEKLFGDIIPETCESNFDCERPEICCDFGFKKICCASGTMVGNKLYEPAVVPVPADIYPPGQEPRNF